jgi:hypothetical protein
VWTGEKGRAKVIEQQYLNGSQLTHHYQVRATFNQKKKRKRKRKKERKKGKGKKDYIIALLVWSGTNSSDIVVDCLMDTESTQAKIHHL